MLPEVYRLFGLHHAAVDVGAQQYRRWEAALSAIGQNVRCKSIAIMRVGNVTRHATEGEYSRLLESEPP